MIPARVSLGAFLLACCLATPALGEETGNKISLDEVVVTDKKTSGVLGVKERQPNTESTISREGLERLGGAGQINAFQAIDALPSVNC